MGLTRTLVLSRKPRSQVQTRQPAVLHLYYKAGRREKWMRLENRKILPRRHHSAPSEGRRLVAIPAHQRLRDVQGCGTSLSVEPRLPRDASGGTAPARPGSGAGKDSPRGRRSAAGLRSEGRGRPPSPQPAPPARPPRPPHPSASASRRRKCCVADFRVLSGGCSSRASLVSGPPPPPPRVLEPGATLPPWPASKVGRGCRAREG